MSIFVKACQDSEALKLKQIFTADTQKGSENMIGVIGFFIGTAVTGLVWYVKDYCFDCLYLKGYSRGYKKAEKDLQKENKT